MGYKLARHPEDRFSRDEFSFFDEFNYYVDADLWTKLVETGTTVAHEGPGRSRLKIEATTTDNNEAGVFTTNELFKFVADKAIVAEARIEYAEAATDDANVAFGFADAAGANLVTDNGAGITATDALLIYKVDGGTKWKAHSEINGAANRGGHGSSSAPTALTQSETTAGGTAAQTLRMEAIPVSGTVYEVRYYVDGVALKDANGIIIQHGIELGTATDMDLGVYLKTGGAQTETVFVDYIYAAQVR